MSKRPSQARRFVPTLEGLEQRWCPSVTIQRNGPDLRIEGDDRANDVRVVDNGQGGVTVTADGRTATFTGIARIEARTRGGNDNFEYSLTGNALTPMRLLVDLGSGADTAALRADAVRLAAAVEVEVNGGTGNDRITANYNNVDVDNQFRFRLNGDDGNDTVAANIALAAGSTGTVEARVKGGAGDDNLTLNVTGSAASVQARLDGDEGFDRCASAPNVEVRGCEAPLV
jgi:hypothetical protein